MVLAGLMLLSICLLENAAIISTALISIDGFIPSLLALLALFWGHLLYLNYDNSVQEKWLVDIPGFIKAADKNWPEMN